LVYKISISYCRTIRRYEAAHTFGKRFAARKYICICAIAILANISGLASPAFAQALTPDVAGIIHDQANRAAESQAAARNAHRAGPIEIVSNSQAALGPFPHETPCWTIREIAVDGANRSELQWITLFVRRFERRCMATKGVRYVLNSLQGALINRGLVGTRPLVPEQDLSRGVLHIRIEAGIISAIRAPNDRAAREWSLAAPHGAHAGELFQLHAVEQGVQQIQRIQGRQAHLTLDPASTAGEAVANLTLTEVPLVAVTLAANNFSGKTVGGWQGSATMTAQDVLGLNEFLTLNYNSRIRSPDVPAGTEGDYATFSIPLGWWTVGATGSTSRYQQQIRGSVATFESLGTQRGISVWAQASVHRDQASQTSLQLQVQRRWNRSYIDRTEIGLQHQDLADIQAAILDARNFGNAEVDTEISYRQGLPTILGAQKDEPGRTSDLPTARYKLAVLDLAGRVPLDGSLLSGYRLEARGQYAFNQPYGPDLFAVGGVYSVRGYDPDAALLGKSGWYARQELTGAPMFGNSVQSFVFLDLGQAGASNKLLGGLGIGLRASWQGFNLMGFAADALSRTSASQTSCCRLGVSLSYGFTAL
jgi:hemolysin activation/secretion protein